MALLATIRWRIRMPDSHEPLVRASGLTKQYRVSHGVGRHKKLRALDGIDLEVDRGQALGIVGESGSGKSTFARLLVKLEEPTAGTLEVAGEDVSRLRGRRAKQWRRGVQMVFQDPISSLDPRMTVGEIVAEPWRIHPGVLSREKRPAELRRLLDAVGLTPDLATRKARQLSGGQAQRVAIARALAVRPSLLVCDEPLASLDVSIQSQVLDVLRDVRQSHGVSFVFISHDLAVVREFCDRVAVMYLGKIVEQGTADEVCSTPQHPYTRALISAEPQVGDLTTERIVLRGEVPSPLAIPSGCRFRTRCWMAADICATDVPVLREVGPSDHRSACHFSPVALAR
jgi:oligopeptide transport system ATP-binding protein